MLFSPERLGQEDIDLLNVGFPLVLLGERMFGGPTDHVTMHNVESAQAATEHLIGIGRRRIAVIGAHPVNQDDIRSANLRIRGYRQALEAAGIPDDPSLVRVAAPWHRENGAAAMRSLLEEGVSFDAVFTLNDTLGHGALRALGEAGVRVPDDVAVIGFDNIDESRFSVPSLSSVEPGPRSDRPGRRRSAARADQREGRSRAAAPGPRRLPHRGRESTGFTETLDPVAAVTAVDDLSASAGRA